MEQNRQGSGITENSNLLQHQLNLRVNIPKKQTPQFIVRRKLYLKKTRIPNGWQGNNVLAGWAAMAGILELRNTRKRHEYVLLRCQNIYRRVKQQLPTQWTR